MIQDNSPDCVVALRKGQAVRWADLVDRVAAVANHYAGRQRVALVCRDGLDFAAGFLGLLHAGADVVLPANTQIGALADIPGGCEAVLDDAAVAAATGGMQLGPIDSRGAAITFFTSGSTGAPKEVTRSLAMMEHEIRALDAAFGALPAGPVLATVSQQHLYGLTFKLLWPLAVARPFMAETFDVWEAVVAAGPGAGTVISSPAHLSRLGGLAALSGSARPGAVFSAGAPLAAADAWVARDILGVLPTEIFGSTESGAIATRQQANGSEDWTLLPNIELRVDAGGVAAFRGPQVAGWVTTGDVVAPGPGGFRFIGRADGIMKVEGKRVATAEVEAALAALPWVEAAMVLLLPGPPVRLAAAVIPSPDGWQALRSQGHFRFGRSLAQALASRMEPAGRPKRWRFVTDLPWRPMGKRDAAALAALFVAPPT